VATTNFLTKVNKLFDFIYYGLRLFCFGVGVYEPIQENKNKR